MQIVLNGEKRNVPESCTVDELLSFVEVNPDRIAVELEGSIIKPENFNSTRIQPASTVEIIHFVGGG